MKLAMEEWEFQIELTKDYIPTLVIENKVKFRELILDIKNQLIGLKGKLALSKSNKSIPIKKNLELIIDFTAIDLNERKIIKALYEAIVQNILDSEMYVEYLALHSNQLNFLENISFDAVTNIDYEDQVDINAFLKLMNVKVLDESEDIGLKLVEYAKLINQFISDTSCFILVNTKAYFEPTELELIVKQIQYEGVPVLLLENQAGYLMDSEKQWIIDEDNCQIF